MALSPPCGSLLRAEPTARLAAIGNLLAESSPAHEMAQMRQGTEVAVVTAVLLMLINCPLWQSSYPRSKTAVTGAWSDQRSAWEAARSTYASTHLAARPGLDIW